jgi:hypothetical protein
MRVFVSSQIVDRWPAGDLIQALRRVGVGVEHSPRNPRDGKDSRWRNWYSETLLTTLDRCDALVIVVEPGWDSSTWMASEAQAALAPGRRTEQKAFFWNPGGTRVTAAGMVGYLRVELPSDLDAAVAVLRGSAPDSR